VLEVEGFGEAAAESCNAGRIVVNMGEKVGIEREGSWERGRAWRSIREAIRGLVTTA
jgi:hypothetical protein